ncbi:MAG: FeoA family protein, partial [Lachnospiraceae bacterium]|nr:FeoA family protein [Lachnospiraceae bacterium]
MMPLAFAAPGEELMVGQVHGNDETKQHLSDLGFVPGARLNVLSQNGGDVILTLMSSKLCLTRQMAEKILVVPSEGR